MKKTLLILGLISLAVIPLFVRAGTAYPMPDGTNSLDMQNGLPVGLGGGKIYVWWDLDDYVFPIHTQLMADSQYLLSADLFEGFSYKTQRSGIGDCEFLSFDECQGVRDNAYYIGVVEDDGLFYSEFQDDPPPVPSTSFNLKGGTVVLRSGTLIIK